MRIIEPATSVEWKQYYDLRFEVLRKPWNETYASTKDGQEDISGHYLLLIGDEPVATGRLQFNNDEEGQIRSMAVRADQQGKGLGSVMVRYIEMKAKERRLKRIMLDARENAVKFYESLGYRVIGESYLLFGTIQHYRMEKEI